MKRRRLTGAGALGFNVDWETVAGDADVARRVITFLEDRRVLFGERHMEDERYCVRSAQEIRAFMTEQISSAKPGKTLEASLRAIRGACRAFVESGGPEGQTFGYHGHDHMTQPFSLALGDLRGRVGMHAALIADRFDLEVEWELASIFPPEDEDDASWIPGMDGEPEH